MDNIIVQILFMMAFTFAIGFAVAVIIKLIASAADRLDFSHSHAVELKRLRHIKKLHRIHIAHLTTISAALRGGTIPSYEEELNRMGEETVSGNYFPKSSFGLSEFDIMDYYYPDEKIKIIEKSKTSKTSK